MDSQTEGGGLDLVFRVDVRGGEDMDVVEETDGEMGFQRNTVMSEVTSRFAIGGMGD